MVYFAFFYGLFTLMGGVMGYVKAHSTTSLMTGGISGLLILLSAFAMLKEKAFGYYGLLALSALLGIFFLMRFMKSFAIMPAGLMVLLSAIMLVGLLMKKPAFLS